MVCFLMMKKLLDDLLFFFRVFCPFFYMIVFYSVVTINGRNIPTTHVSSLTGLFLSFVTGVCIFVAEAS